MAVVDKVPCLKDRRSHHWINPSRIPDKGLVKKCSFCFKERMVLLPSSTNPKLIYGIEFYEPNNWYSEKNKVNERINELEKEINELKKNLNGK